MKQCKKCPWRVDVDPHTIPDGYDVEKHKALGATIAKPADVSRIGLPITAMACHESTPARSVSASGGSPTSSGRGTTSHCACGRAGTSRSRWSSWGSSTRRSRTLYPRRMT